MTKHKVMGVINITPDSFSDGGQFNQKSSFILRCQNFLASNVSILDIGAESTAPFNQSIGLDEEIKRFEKCLFNSYDFLDTKKIEALSIDTYRFETFKCVYDFLIAKKFEGKIFWNDVSGQYKDGLFEFLQNKAAKANYIISHNLVPTRELTSRHMEYANEEVDIVSSVKSFFTDFIEMAKYENVLDRVMLDPCFGFSKTLKQNYELINRIDDVLHADIPVLLGVSRKSFLKKLGIEDGHSSMDPIAQLDCYTSNVICLFLKKLASKNVTHRVHDPLVFSMATQFNKFIY